MSRSYPEACVKALWGLAGGRCSLCKLPLTRVSQDGTVIIGDQAHIDSFSAKGPQRKTVRKIDKTGDNSYRNLILLCPTHHREVDK